MIYYIAGASGSGKTAIISGLKKILGEAVSVYDFDDIGVPEGADKKWRQKSTEKWLQKLLQENKDACLLGQMVLGEILACLSAKQIDKVNFCLLDVSDLERIQRLKKCNAYGVDQNMLNWSSWLRMHHQDPQWMQQVLKEDCWSDLDFSTWEQLENWESKANVKVIDTTGFNIQQTAAAVAKWVNKDDIHAENIPNSEYILQNSLKEDYEYIYAQFQSFDQSFLPFTQNPPRIEKNYVIKHKGATVAGIYADIYYWKILYICILYVNEGHRHKNLGSILLRKVEEEARVMGSTLSHLDTYDFQSKDFYLKQGYEIFGVLEDCPKDHKRYFLKKIL